MKTPRWLLITIGTVLALEGTIGAVSPSHFRALVVWLQSDPAWPASVLARAVLGGLLLAAPRSIRHPRVVRAVGVITIVGAAVGVLATSVQSLPEGDVWRLPAIALAIAGMAVVWASQRSGLRPNNTAKSTLRPNAK